MTGRAGRSGLHKERESQDISSGKAVKVMERIIKAVLASMLTVIIKILSEEREG